MFNILINCTYICCSLSLVLNDSMMWTCLNIPHVFCICFKLYYMICKKIVVQIHCTLFTCCKIYHRQERVWHSNSWGCSPGLFLFLFSYLPSPPLLSLPPIFPHTLLFPPVSFPFPGNVTRFKMDIRRFLPGKMFDCEITVAKSGLHFRIF